MNINSPRLEIVRTYVHGTKAIENITYKYLGSMIKMMIGGAI